MMSAITSSYANVSSSFFSQKFQKNIEELLVAPVPTHIIIWGFVTGGVGRSVLVGSLVTIISLFFVPLHVYSWAIVVITLLMTAILFSLAGLLNGIFAQSFDDVSIVPTFVLQPLTYLGGVFYAISMLPPFWQAVSKINPIVYDLRVPLRLPWCDGRIYRCIHVDPSVIHCRSLQCLLASN